MEEDILACPNLMSREDLIRILKERYLKIPNLDELDTAEIIKIYSKFALPLNSRKSEKQSQKADASSNPCQFSIIQKETFNCSKNRVSLKRNITALETNNIEITHTKLIKLNNINEDNPQLHLEFQQKRLFKNINECNSLDQSIEQCQQKFKRQKITWP